ncbi:hypothetical protein AGABI1DRAFT_91151 [Agaricus bisporus var. burnettii JB137-S8]|uniref:Uncharacterized protein n=1 Tax=Agaricus bisporus var. burnettii (strain JB137-S8 / ATCC MYA-4627 / FGSC 10392) TaxID=597362 RepID=K5X984_AGABU|nr:uncharacterized protein AGABI1DRAFT_91151 [Agaricus bisporus var. burnettii JB137-S8]EKM79778.1 hypothetical protein AGABI1DRAFT_91151 [Agaricus bisporus var. burnettii JB137-S8]
MHLIWENLIPNLILFWTGSFKDLDHEDEAYVISPAAWKDIGERTAACKSTIPSAFGAPVPNIATQRGQMTSEMYSNWTLFIAPLVLFNRFQQPVYYKHFIKLVNLLKMCLEFEISEEMLDQIDGGFKSWVEEYENRLYYRYQPHRLSACPLTLHALLHIAWGIRIAGPVWTYWAFPMERHCNALLPSIRSRRHPYASISAFVTAMAQLHQIRLKYNVHLELCLSPEVEKFSRNAFVSDSYPSYKLHQPRRLEVISLHLQDKFYAALATRFEKTKAVIQAIVDLNKPITQYGRITCLGGGDTIYVQMVDKYARYQNRRSEYVKRTFFGQAKRVLVLDLPTTPQLGLSSPSTVIYLVVEALKIRVENNLIYYSETGPIELVDLDTVQCLVGRVWDRNRWGIVDRSNVTIAQLD